MQVLARADTSLSFAKTGPARLMDVRARLRGSRRWSRSFVHSELLTQGQILESQLAVAAKEEGEKPKQVE